MIHVRPATPFDAPVLAALAREAHAYHAAQLPGVFQPADAVVLTADEAAANLRAPNAVWLVADAPDAAGGRVVVGYLHAEAQRVPASPYKRAAARLHVHGMGVTAAARGQGVGRALLAAVRAEAVSLGLAEVTLEVYAFNAAARALYATEGFTPMRELLHWAPGGAASPPAD